jgi:hypothetical protein
MNGLAMSTDAIGIFLMGWSALEKTGPILKGALQG